MNRDLHCTDADITNRRRRRTAFQLLCRHTDTLTFTPSSAFQQLDAQKTLRGRPLWLALRAVFLAIAVVDAHTLRQSSFITNPISLGRWPRTRRCCYLSLGLSDYCTNVNCHFPSSFYFSFGHQQSQSHYMEYAVKGSLCQVYSIRQGTYKVSDRSYFTFPQGPSPPRPPSRPPRPHQGQKPFTFHDHRDRSEGLIETGTPGNGQPHSTGLFHAPSVPIHTPEGGQTTKSMPLSGSITENNTCVRSRIHGVSSLSPAQANSTLFLPLTRCLGYRRHLRTTFLFKC